MIKNKKIIAALMAGAMIITGAGCNLVERTEGSINRQVVAKGNGVKIKRGEVDTDPSIVAVIEDLKEKYGANYMQDDKAATMLLNYKKAVINNMLSMRILEDKEAEYKTALSEAEMDKKIDEKLKEQIEAMGGQEEFDKSLEKYKITLDEVKDDIRYGIRSQELKDAVTKDVKLEEGDAKKYYDENQELFTEQPNEVKVSYMLLSSQEEADEAIKKLDEGMSFAELAKGMSQDEATKEKGGDLGYVTYKDSKLGTTLATALKTMKVGQYEIVEDARGFNVVKVEDKKDYPVKEFDVVKEDIDAALLNALKNQVWSDNFTKWIKEVDLKINEEKLV